MQDRKKESMRKGGKKRRELSQLQSGEKGHNCENTYVRHQFGGKGGGVQEGGRPEKEYTDTERGEPLP